jgi:tripartite ATP-independent transporter DctP family solute receptor
MLNGLDRRRLMLGTAAGAVLPLFSIVRARGDAPEFEWKFANDNPASHPNSLRGQEACDKIREESHGRMVVSLFPNNQLGGDTDMLSQLRSGALELFTLSGGILSTYIPVASIYGVGYAFKGYDDVYRAMDGDLGGLIRRACEAQNIYCFETVWDNGFRQISSSTHPIRNPGDLKGFKIRVPVNPLYLSTFEALGASPTSINFSEVYSALQTKIVEGQENPLANIETAKLYEVQKYVSMTRHIWDGYLMLANLRAWRRLPDDLKAIVTRNLNGAGLRQRADLKKLDDELRATLTGQGITFNDPDPEEFRQVLIKAGFYGRWRDKYGREAWSVLEKYAGAIG